MKFSFTVPNELSAIQVAVGFNNPLPFKSFVLCPSYTFHTSEDLINLKDSIYRNFTWSTNLQSYYRYSDSHSSSNSFQIFPSIGVPDEILHPKLNIFIHPWDASKDSISAALNTVVLCGESRNGPIVVYPEN